MNPIRTLRAVARLSQVELARRAGTSQPAVAAYEASRKSPTWRTLVRVADAAGYHPHLEFVPPLTREDRRSLALHAAIADHLRANPEAVLARARRNLARMHALHEGARPLLDEWAVLLRRPLSALLPVLRDPSPWARELRHVTPFAGVLSARERARVYREFFETEATAKSRVHSIVRTG
jgi:transcriptional regulator with XRE-family HTH domain